MIYPAGATSVSLDVFWADDTGAAVTDKVAADFPVCKWSGGSNTADTTITLSDLAAITTAHPNDNTAGGVKEREGGWYRLDLPNNVLTTAGTKRLTFLETTNTRLLSLPIIGGPKVGNFCQHRIQIVDADTIKTQAITAAAGVTFPSSIASPTNITAGTITTVTNLTNAPTAGDLTVTMKTSVTTAATAATPTVTAGTVSDKTGYSLSAPGVQAIWDALTSALTTAGSIGKWVLDKLDVVLSTRSKPADTVARVTLVDTTTSNTDMRGTDSAALAANWTSARAGYLDNLNIGGVVASQADVTAINTSSSKHVILATVGQYERPESGTTTYTVEARTFLAADGSSVNADATPTLTATGQTTGSLAANVGAVTNPATGVYRWAYAVTSEATVEPIRFDVSATISAATFTLSAYSQVVDEVSVTWTATNNTQLTAVYNKLPVNNIADETLVLAAIADVQTEADDIQSKIGTPSATLAADIATRLATVDYTAPLSAAGTRTAIGLAAANLDTQLAAKATQSSLDSLVTTVGAAGAGLTAADDVVIAAIAALAFATPANVTSAVNAIEAYGDIHWLTATGFAVAGSAMTLTSGERTAVANEVEAQIIDETDSEKVLTAITDKIASVNPTLGDLSLAAIASAVRTNLATELARIDVVMSTRSKPADTVARVTLVDTVTTNADMRGTDNAALAAVWTSTRGGYLDKLNISGNAASAAETAAIQASVDTLPVTIIDAMTGDGITPAKAFEMIAAMAAGQVSISHNAGVVTLTYKKRDGTTTSFTVIVNEVDKTRDTTGAMS